MLIDPAPDRTVGVPPTEPASATTQLYPFRAPELAVIAPTLNERDNLIPLLAQLEEALAGRAWEVIFVDDGSTDGTAEAVEALARERRNVRLLRRHGRRGLASAILEGMLATVAPVVAVIDADLQHDAGLLPALADAVAGGAELAVGTRYAGDGSIGEWDRSRAAVSALGTRMARLVSHSPCSDPLSGFFAVRRALVLELLPRLSVVGFKLLLDLLASSPRPLKVAELPYRFGCRQAGASKLDAMVGVEYGLLLLDKMVGVRLPPRMLLALALMVSTLLANLAAFALGVRLFREPFPAAEGAAVVASVLLACGMSRLLFGRDRRRAGGRWWRGLTTHALASGPGAAVQLELALRVLHRGWMAAFAGAAIGAAWNGIVSGYASARR